MHEYLRYDPVVFSVGADYQILFWTTTMGIGWIEIDGERFTDEEVGLLHYGEMHKIPVSGAVLNRAGHYTVVFVEYKEKPPYFPKGEEKIRETYDFVPYGGGDLRLFQFADTHGAVEVPLETYRAFAERTGGADLLVLNGDINDSSDRIDCFATTFALAGGAVHGTRPVLYARGNHDTRGHAAELLPGYSPTAFRDGRRESFWSFRQGDVWGVILDCGEDKYDHNIEYGGTIFFDNFRRRETAYLESLIANRENEFDAPGVGLRIAICHVPFVEHFKFPFDVGGEYYERWTALLAEMHIDLLLCGHMHTAYFVKPHAPDHRDAAFPTAVLSIPPKEYDGKTLYTGGAILRQNGKREAVIVRGDTFVETMEF